MKCSGRGWKRALRMWFTEVEEVLQVDGMVRSQGMMKSLTRQANQIDNNDGSVNCLVE